MGSPGILYHLAFHRDGGAYAIRGTHQRQPCHPRRAARAIEPHLVVGFRDSVGVLELWAGPSQSEHDP